MEAPTLPFAKNVPKPMKLKKSWCVRRNTPNFFCVHLLSIIAKVAIVYTGMGALPPSPNVRPYPYLCKHAIAVFWNFRRLRFYLPKFAIFFVLHGLTQKINEVHRK